jgi:quercetin dioxygenase-like cupin family protein
VTPDKGRRFWFLGQPLNIKIAGDQTDGAYAMVEAEPEPGFSPAPHVHSNEAEAIYVLDGEFLVTVAGRTFQCRPGSLVHIPRGAVHTHENIGASVGRTLSIYFPAGFEKAFEELGESIGDREAGPSSRPAPDELLRRAGAYGLQVCG